jgi:hypothetical protein
MSTTSNRWSEWDQKAEKLKQQALFRKKLAADLKALQSEIDGIGHPKDYKAIAQQAALFREKLKILLTKTPRTPVKYARGEVAELKIEIYEIAGTAPYRDPDQYKELREAVSTRLEKIEEIQEILKEEPVPQAGPSLSSP